MRTRAQRGFCCLGLFKDVIMKLGRHNITGLSGYDNCVEKRNKYIMKVVMSDHLLLRTKDEALFSWSINLLVLVSFPALWIITVLLVLLIL